jgi:hypothetical protein
MFFMAAKRRKPISEKEIADARSRLMPDEAIVRWLAGICLFCQEKIEDDEAENRGCHSRCYQVISRKVRARDSETSDEDEIKAGRWAPPNPTGRPSRYDEVVPDASKEQRIAGIQFGLTGTSKARINRASELPEDEPVDQQAMRVAEQKADLEKRKVETKAKATSKVTGRKKTGGE